jgi:hypothetical protein
MIQQNYYTIEDLVFQRGPWEVFDTHKYALGSHLDPWID